MVMPLTCEAERAFSRLRQLKSYCRSTIKGRRLNGLAVMLIHRDISVSISDVVHTFTQYPQTMRLKLLTDASDDIID